MKALFVGLGSVGQRHLRNLRALKRDAIDIIAWRALGLNRVITDGMQAEDGADPVALYQCREVSTLDAGFAEKPDYTFVCNPTSMHVPVALAALRGGSNVFVEKPLSHNLKDVEKLADEALQRNLVGYVGYQFRFHPAIQCLKKLLQDDAIGRVLAVQSAVGEYLPGFHEYEDYRTTYAARSDLGGGVVLTHSHELDYLCHLFGMPNRVFAVGGQLSDLEVDVDDMVALIMECGSPARPLPVTLMMDYVQRPPVRNCVVIGEHGKIVIDLAAPSLVKFGPNGEANSIERWPDFRRNDMFIDQLNHFLACCDGDQQPESTLLDGTQVLKVALATLHSVRTRGVVEVEA
jgi:predicted dehydrogenase